DVARHRRCGGDRRLALLLPRDRARDVHAPRRGRAARRDRRRRRSSARAVPQCRRWARARRLRWLALPGPAAFRPRQARGPRLLRLMLPRWTAYPAHGQEHVGCVAVQTGAGLVFIDPLDPPAELGRPDHVLVTVYWHERSAAGAPRIWAAKRSAR